MKRTVKMLSLTLLVAFIIIQFIPTEKNQSDVTPMTDFSLVNNVPQNISTLLKQSCYDCHSNNTHYPWYNKIQPAAWFLEQHIKDGKDELNFNEWGKYSSRRKNSKLKSIINQIEEEEMPLSSYTFIHSDAILSKSEKELVVSFMKEIKDGLKQSTNVRRRKILFQCFG